MKHLFPLIAATVISASAQSAAAAEFNPKVTPYYEYLNSNVAGRRLVLQSDPCAVPIPGTNIRCTFSASNKLVGLKRTENGLSYKYVASVKQTNFVPQADGTTVTENKDRDIVQVCEFRAMKAIDAPDALLGFCRTDVNTSSDPTGLVQVAQMKLTATGLQLSLQTGNYFDAYFNNPAGNRLGTSETEENYTVENGKLKRLGQYQNYFIDDNGARFPAGEGSESLYSEE